MSNIVAASRFAVIAEFVKYDSTFDCSYRAQIFSATGNLLSTVFDKDVRDDHAFFVMLLNKDQASPETFLTFFAAERELLDYLLDWYQCYQLKEDIRAARILIEKRKIVSSFTKGIEQRIAARREKDLPMFVPNEY